MPATSRRLLRVLTTLAAHILAGFSLFTLIAAEHRLPGGPVPEFWLKLALVGTVLSLWFYTQKLLGRRPASDEVIGDALHELTARWNRALADRPTLANRLLIAGSAGIDLSGLFLLGGGIFGASLRPIISLLLLFAARQVCQKLCALRPPAGMIWRHPGAPSLLVTYEVGNDFFFSGHTAISALATLELWRIHPALGAAGALLTAGEVALVLVLRAHYTMDVFAALVAAVAADRAGAALASACGL